MCLLITMACLGLYENGVLPTGAGGRKTSVFRKRDGDNKDIATAMYNYPAGAKPANLAPYKVISFNSDVQ